MNLCSYEIQFIILSPFNVNLDKIILRIKILDKIAVHNFIFTIIYSFMIYKYNTSLNYKCNTTGITLSVVNN